MELTQELRALLDTIAGTESPGYDVMYGGRRFNSFADHPRQRIPIRSGPNRGKTSSAAGKYQFLAPTWDQQKQKLGLNDFGPRSQDIAAADLAKSTYGDNLQADLASGDPNRIGSIGKRLSGKWTSLPSGIEATTNTNRFANAYQQNLRKWMPTPQKLAGIGSPGQGQGMPAPPPTMMAGGKPKPPQMAQGPHPDFGRPGTAPPTQMAQAPLQSPGPRPLPTPPPLRQPMQPPQLSANKPGGWAGKPLPQLASAEPGGGNLFQRIGQSLMGPSPAPQPGLSSPMVPKAGPSIGKGLGGLFGALAGMAGGSAEADAAAKAANDDATRKRMEWAMMNGWGESL